MSCIGNFEENMDLSRIYLAVTVLTYVPIPRISRNDKAKQTNEKFPNVQEKSNIQQIDTRKILTNTYYLCSYLILNMPTYTTKTH